VEQEVENHLKLRMKQYIPQDFDLVDYDRELLKKQLDLETVRVTLKRDPEREADPENPAGQPFYVRHIERETNEEGMFRRLQEELSKMAQQYSITDEDINDMFISVSCNKKKLIELLQGNDFTKWNELEDMALGMDTNSPQYKYLLKQKGQEEINRRKKFLGLQ